MTKKKYVLADYKYVFDSMEALSAELVRLVESGTDLKDLVIGSYIGIPEINTSIAVNIGGKVKRINKSSTKLEIKQLKNDSKVEKEEKQSVAPAINNDEGFDGNGGVCSFCSNNWVKKTVLEGFDTYLCQYHLDLETKLAEIKA